MYNEQEVYIYIGKQIKQARQTTFQHRVMPQRELAQAAGCTFQQIQKYEKASNKVSLFKLHKIAEYTQKPLGYFVPNSVIDTISG
tara:strand:+ start:32 stop:286 length:255 start_codon:yes stop_codon:yes gene_type:complete